MSNVLYCEVCGTKEDKTLDHKVYYCELCGSSDHKTIEHRCKICGLNHLEIDDSIHPVCKYCDVFKDNKIVDIKSRMHNEAEHECSRCEKKGHQFISFSLSTECEYSRFCNICRRRGHYDEDHKCFYFPGRCKIVSKDGRIGYGHDLEMHTCKICNYTEHETELHPCSITGCPINDGLGHDEEMHRCIACKSSEHKLDKHMCTVCGTIGHSEKTHKVCYCNNYDYCKCNFCNSDHCSSRHECKLCTGFGHECSISDKQIGSSIDDLKAEIYLLRSTVRNLAITISGKADVGR